MRIIMPSRILISLIFFSLASLPASGQEWARFRGPNGTGVSTATLPAKWTDADYRWKTALPGSGHSSPVLWGERLFLTAGEDKTGQRIALCVGTRDGAVLWRKNVDGHRYPLHRRNSIATATPAVDDKHVYISWAVPEKCELIALDHDGKLVWQADLGRFKGNHGFGSSPIVVGKLVVLANDQDGAGFLIALDRDTGKERWKIFRESGNATYATPCVYKSKDAGELLIFTNWKHGITAVEPESGKIRWELSCFAPKLQERSIASPVVAGNLILGTCGFVTGQKHFVAVRPEDKSAKEVWRLEKAVSYLPTPLVNNGHIYLCSEAGIATCLDAATGKQLWQERLGNKFSASPVSAGNQIYCVADDGTVYVLAAANKFQLLGKSSLGEPTQSTPAIAGGTIYFRTPGHLFALTGK
jgi:outer membrane protein assembly factor BamB